MYRFTQIYIKSSIKNYNTTKPLKREYNEVTGVSIFVYYVSSTTTQIMELLKVALLIVSVLLPSVDSTPNRVIGNPIDPFDNSDVAGGFITDGYQTKISAVCDNKDSYRCVPFNDANIRKCRVKFANGLRTPPFLGS